MEAGSKPAVLEVLVPVCVDEWELLCFCLAGIHADGTVGCGFEQGPCKLACSSCRTPYCHSYAALIFRKPLLQIFFFLIFFFLMLPWLLVRGNDFISLQLGFICKMQINMLSL